MKWKSPTRASPTFSPSSKSHWIGREVEGDQYYPAEVAFFRDVVSGVQKDQLAIDRRLDDALAIGWPLKRVEALMRAILRAAYYELKARPDVPARVVIAEYVDLANAFYGPEESGMINAVLDVLGANRAPGVRRARLTQRRRGLAALRRGDSESILQLEVESRRVWPRRYGDPVAKLELCRRSSRTARMGGAGDLRSPARTPICGRSADESDALHLARLHCRAWRALIAGDDLNYEGLRTELVAAAIRSGLEVECLERGDAQTMAELLDIVIMRFQRSGRQASAYRLALFELAERLVAAGEAS